MALAAGARLGPYEVLGLIGAGGMGEVYRAKDTRLDRTVAIKILPPDFDSDPHRRARFDREAKTIATLSHPYICTLHDVGEHASSLFLVMEHLEGQTLADRLRKGPLPINQALEYGAQIAEALSAAHRAGIIHRDLKPGNVMLTKSGVKLLDFGLAKLKREPAYASPASGTAVPTHTEPLTSEGTFVGTLNYMAPEQIEGKEADTRTDIWALGLVLYEMLTGRKAFDGHSHASVIAAILEHEPPPISILQRMAPPALDHLVNKCVAKNPEDRWESARDLRDELKWIGGTTSRAVEPAAVRRNRVLLIGPLVAIVTAALLALATVHLRESPTDVSRVAFSLPLPASLDPRVGAPEISPDGKRLVFADRTPDGRLVLWLRSLDSVVARPLSGTESDWWQKAFWSPDGQSLGFFADTKLKTIDVFGGPPHTLADAPNPSGGTWSSAGIILFGPNRRGPLYQLSASGGTPTPVLQLDRSRQETIFDWPRFLPDGRHFLYVVTSADAARDGVYLGALDGKDTRLLIRDADKAVYSPPGYLLFTRGGTLFGQSFDPGKMQISGDAFSVPGQEGEGIRTWDAFSASRNGILTYVTSGPLAFRLNWYDRQGKVLETIGDAAWYSSIVLSPDEKRLALEMDRHISVLDLASGVTTRQTPVGGDPVWSPDGRQLIFTWFDGPSGNLYRKLIAGGEAEPFFKSGESKYTQQWLKDGTSILFINQDTTTLYRLPLAGDLKPEKLLQAPFAHDEFRLSPDEHWVAYNSLETGRWEVYVASFPSLGGQVQVSSGGGCQPHWRKDGKELFYLSLQGKLMAVDVATGASFEAGAPRELFQTSIAVHPVIDQYDVTGDGKRFIVITPVANEQPITVMLNWMAGLKR